MIHGHRLLGVSLADYLTGTPYAVELEKELARKRRILDILIVRAAGRARR